MKREKACAFAGKNPGIEAPLHGMEVKKSYKSISRILYSDYSERLSFIWEDAHTSALAANPRTSGEQPSNVRLFGISARKVYPQTLLP